MFCRRDVLKAGLKVGLKESAEGMRRSGAWTVQTYRWMAAKSGNPSRAHKALSIDREARPAPRPLFMQNRLCLNRARSQILPATAASPSAAPHFVKLPLPAQSASLEMSTVGLFLSASEDSFPSASDMIQKLAPKANEKKANAKEFEARTSDADAMPDLEPGQILNPNPSRLLRGASTKVIRTTKRGTAKSTRDVFIGG